MKHVSFMGDSLVVIRSFPEAAKREVGYQIDRIQRNLEPSDWKPMKSIGVGVREIRVRDATGAYRIIYITKYKNNVAILHAFQKKTQKTSKHDLTLAKNRYKQLMKELPQ